jgi:hypothetical protein
MRNVEFDIKENLFSQKARFDAIVSQFFKAYVWYHENLKPTEAILKQTEKKEGSVPVLYMELELTGDELEFIRTALVNEIRRRF